MGVGGDDRLIQPGGLDAAAAKARASGFIDRRRCADAVRNGARKPARNEKGYDPYDSGRLGKKAPPAKKDLRKLSEWLKLKKQAEANQAQGDKDEEPQE